VGIWGIVATLGIVAKVAILNKLTPSIEGKNTISIQGSISFKLERLFLSLNNH
jgi:hypothetical protein